MAAKTWNVGIIGYGFSAKIFHIPFIQAVPDLKLYAIVQRNPQPENNAEKDHPDIKAYRSADDLVKDEAVDVVIVTTAPSSHVELAKLALEAGKHGMIVYVRRPPSGSDFVDIQRGRSGSLTTCHTVVVEKPFTATHKEADELVALAKKQNKLLAVYQSAYQSCPWGIRIRGGR
jgi:predicted dehydrogenase